MAPAVVSLLAGAVPPGPGEPGAKRQTMEWSSRYAKPGGQLSPAAAAAAPNGPHHAAPTPCGCHRAFDGSEAATGMGEGFMGKHFGGYVLGARIYGDRKHSEVREGYAAETGERVAVKLFCERSDEALNAFDEAAVLKELDHKNVVRLHGTAQEGRVRATAVDWIDGRTLRRRVTKSGPLTEEAARPLFQQLMGGLAHCHARGIAHRDVKPENVMVTPSGRVVLVDFGFAVRSRPGEYLRKTCGTVLFMAPEVLGKLHYEGPPSDVWSAGATLYECLFGRSPFEASEGEKEKGAVRERILSARFDVPPSASPELADLLRWMLRREPGQRPTAVEALGHAWFSVPPRELSHRKPSNPTPLNAASSAPSVPPLRSSTGTPLPPSASLPTPKASAGGRRHAELSAAVPLPPSAPSLIVSPPARGQPSSPLTATLSFESIGPKTAAQGRMARASSAPLLPSAPPGRPPRPVSSSELRVVVTRSAAPAEEEPAAGPSPGGRRGSGFRGFFRSLKSLFSPASRSHRRSRSSSHSGEGDRDRE